ncbi:hypothetical protein [Nocardioides sp. GY 10127]|uniref:hypothetical protein n=1 Tax=Nocardioides sp. GY 10127 TaxID=2569762 RepID=UPI0010A8C4CC|nr:hypothetical protein [Nocardioides sp. GY 10127]TIC82948.1 hypothetical protein E8D37_09900 [Nocardioides sp. GY 10127]
MFRRIAITELVAGWGLGLVLAVFGTLEFVRHPHELFGFLTAVLAMPLLGCGALAGIALVAGDSRASRGALVLAATAFVLVVTAWVVLTVEVV